MRLPTSGPNERAAGAAAQHRVTNAAGRRAAGGNGPWPTGHISQGLWPAVARLASRDPVPGIGLSSVWRAAPIIQLCAGCGLPRNASLGVQNGGDARMRNRRAITVGNEALV